MVAVANTDDKFQLTGVTFVPNHDYWSYNNGGAALRFPGAVAGPGSPRASPGADRQSGHHGAGHCRQTLWDAGSTHQHYTTDEDSSGIALNVKAGLTGYGRLPRP